MLTIFVRAFVSTMVSFASISGLESGLSPDGGGGFRWEDGPLAADNGALGGEASGTENGVAGGAAITMVTGGEGGGAGFVGV